MSLYLTYSERVNLPRTYSRTYSEETTRNAAPSYPLLYLRNPRHARASTFSQLLSSSGCTVPSAQEREQSSRLL